VKKIVLLLFFFYQVPLHSQTGEASRVAGLDSAIRNKPYFIKQKGKRIAVFKQRLLGDLTVAQEYSCNKNLYSEYRKFRLDSAIYFVRRNLRLANDMKNQLLVDEAQLELANLYSSSGKYRESEIILKSIDKKRLSPSLFSIYYEAYSQFFEHYATNTYSDVYVKNIEIYRDSLLSVLDTSSVSYKINLAQKHIFQKQLGRAQKDLLRMLPTLKDKNADYAMISYLIGSTYGLQGKNELEKDYFLVSAITDVKNAIMDNAAMQNLALIYYQKGNIDEAYKCTRSAIEDAIFCTVKFRTLQMSELYSIINSAYLDKEARRKGELQSYLLLISVLSLFLILTILYIYKQMKKVSKVREELRDTSEKLAALNADISSTNLQLSESNAQLSEANRVKEEYIAHFFDLCSTYINKLENYRKTLNKKANDKQLDELFKMLKSNTIVENELEELYKNFDNIFLNLYPTFVKDFNALLINDEQVVPKQGELLNTELRIFALIRLGITDSVKIAAFLRYSLSTIYNYRTKARNKAAVSRDEFEQMVSKIGNLRGKW
jgi:tetratricopeptide (TPR) repeat protein